MSASERGRPLIVVHLMKTGGFSLLYQVMANVPQGAMWGVPDGEPDEIASMSHYSSVEKLRSLDADTRSRIQVVMGHLPFAVADMAGFEDPTTATVLRDPVDRVVSYLNMCKAKNAEHRDLPLEEIYEDEFFGPRLIRNHQTKMLGMTVEQASAPPVPTPQDPEVLAQLIADGYFDSEQFLNDVNPSQFGTYMIDTPLVWDVPVDESTLDRARRNVERVDVLGIHDEFDRFLDRLADRMGWTIDHDIRVNAGDKVDLSASFRRRIEDGNALDLELYDHARTVARH